MHAVLGFVEVSMLYLCEPLVREDLVGLADDGREVGLCEVAGMEQGRNIPFSKCEVEHVLPALEARL
jgi:hypothetical protein